MKQQQFVIDSLAFVMQQEIIFYFINKNFAKTHE